MAPDPTSPKRLAKPCPGCGGTNVRATIAQAAEGNPGPDGKPVKPGTAIDECADCGAIATVHKPAAKKKPAKKRVAKRSSSSRPRTTAKRG